MTKLDSILKSRDLTLLKNVHIVKAMVFPVVIYGCESWTIRKAEHQRKGNPLTLLVGMQTSTAAMEISVEIS